MFSSIETSKSDLPTVLAVPRSPALRALWRLTSV